MSTELRSEPLFDQIFAGQSEANRGEQIYRRWREFHLKNPRVWVLFQQFAFQVINSGRKHYSADAILHRIRWHVDIETEGDSQFRLNNDHASYYSRLFAAAYPQHALLFHQRRRTSMNRPAKPIEPTRNTEDVPDEGWLSVAMAELAHANSRDLSR